MSWRIVICNQGEYLKLKLDNLIVYKKGINYSIPLSDISTILVEGLDTTISTRLMNSLSEYNIALITCNQKHEPSGLFLGYNGHSRSTKRLQWQITWSEELKNRFWKEIVSYKLINQLAIARKTTNDIDNIQLIQKYLNEIEPGDCSNREGLCAKVYFKTIFGSDFNRQNDDIINGCMNYGYTILRSFFARVCVSYGLDCRLGVFHKNEYNKFCLVDDLMEPFRPYIDYYILKKYSGEPFLNQKIRYEIVDILNIIFVVNNKKTKLNVLIERYVEAFINAMKNNDTNALIYPEIEGFIGVIDEV